MLCGWRLRNSSIAAFEGFRISRRELRAVFKSRVPSLALQANDEKQPA
jgi:hypothetical protein